MLSEGSGSPKEKINFGLDPRHYGVGNVEVGDQIRLGGPILETPVCSYSRIWIMHKCV
uniref:Uncharacterized protein n=1 Tax=Meloidogyne incognita TaxID=6306 RepID=A0A914L9L2_MELIC